MPEWQPIETAPTDLTTVLLWDRFGCCNIAYHRNGEWIALNNGGEVYEEDARGSEFAKVDGATHWMPLPEPPNEVA